MANQKITGYDEFMRKREKTVAARARKMLAFRVFFGFIAAILLLLLVLICISYITLSPETCPPSELEGARESLVDSFVLVGFGDLAAVLAMNAAIEP